MGNNKQGKIWIVLTIVFFCTTILLLVLLLQTPSMESVEEIQQQNKELKELVELYQLINESETSQTSTTDPENKTYGLGEWWEVPGQWKLRIDEVYPTKKRNSYSDDKPAEVVIIVYTYENLGYQDSLQDLFMTPDGVIDESKKMCETYPVSEGNSPQPTPPGAICEKATETYGLKTESNTIKVMFEQYDDSSHKQKATFEVPVTK